MTILTIFTIKDSRFFNGTTLVAVCCCSCVSSFVLAYDFLLSFIHWKSRLSPFLPYIMLSNCLECCLHVGAAELDKAQVIPGINTPILVKLKSRHLGCRAGAIWNATRRKWWDDFFTQLLLGMWDHLQKQMDKFGAAASTQWVYQKCGII